MKYLRGFLTAAIVALLSWGLISFAAAHSSLVDMVYPYVTRTLQTSLAEWTGSVDFVLWQLLLTVLVTVAVASGILMILLRGNLLQWLGWVLAAASALFLLHTGIYGLNQYAGSVASDIRMDVSGFTLEELEQATTYFRDQANALSEQVSRDNACNASFADFETLAEQAGDGFSTLVYENSYSVYAGSVLPVKKLGWTGFLTPRGITGITCALTGEASVNPDTPDAGLPFVMCYQMARRMCIAAHEDATFSAFLAGQANTHAEFRYSAYLMAYRICISALSSINSSDAQTAAANITNGVSDGLYRDLAAYEAFAGKQTSAPTGMRAQQEEDTRPNACSLLVSWYIQEFILPTQGEQDSRFDPYDEDQVDLSGIVNAKESAHAQNGQ